MFNPRLKRFGRWQCLWPLLILLSACSFDPNQSTRSATQPNDQTTDDGTTWTALKAVGDNDEWNWVPEEVGVVDGWRQAPEGYSLDLLVNGKIYRVTRQNGFFRYMGVVDSDWTNDPWWMELSILLALFLLCAAIFSVAACVEIKQLNGKVEQVKASVEDARAEEVKGHRNIERERRVLEERIQALTSEAESWAAEREALLGRNRALATTARATSTWLATPTREQWLQFGLVVRAEMFRGREGSHELLIQYAFDPTASGAIVFEWEITLGCPMAPTLLVLRDGKLIKQETGNFKGKFGTRLFNRNKRYLFTFKLRDGKREYPETAVFELSVPPFDAWTEPPKPPEKQSKDDWIADNVAALKLWGRWPPDSAGQKEILAKIEAEAIQKFGEAP